VSRTPAPVVVVLDGVFGVNWAFTRDATDGPVSMGRFFFSEEKKQKTFDSLSRFYPTAYAQETKVFWFFFSKKNCLPALASTH
jgi:hypothetical protein